MEAEPAVDAPAAEAAVVGVFHWNPRSGRIALDDAGLAMLGAADNADTARAPQHLMALLDPTHAESLTVRLRSAAQGEAALDARVWLTRGDGDRRQIWLHGSADAAGGVSGHLVDVTDLARGLVIEAAGGSVTTAPAQVRSGRFSWDSGTGSVQLTADAAALLAVGSADVALSLADASRRLRTADVERVRAAVEAAEPGEVLEFDLAADDAAGAIRVQGIVSPGDGGGVAFTGTIRDAVSGPGEQAVVNVSRALQTLSHGSRVMTTATDEQGLLAAMCAAVVERGGYHFCWYGRAEHDENRTVRPVAWAGHEDGYLTEMKFSWADDQYGRGPTGQCIRSGQVRFAHQIQSHPAFNPWRAAALQRGYASSISLPVRVGGRIDGALMVYATESTAFDPTEVSLLSDLARNLGYGMARLRAARELDEARHRLEHAGGHDPLTGLANHSLAGARITRLLAQVRPGRTLALLDVGVDRLGDVNRSLDYGAGDRLLTEVAARVVGVVGDPDTVARVAGNEFVVILADLADGADAAPVADDICAAVRDLPRDIFGGEHPSVSVGVASGGPDASAAELMRRAGLALRQAKDAGRDRYVFFDESVAVQAQRRLALGRELRAALASGEVVPWFQPVVDLTDRRIIGYEALARWIKPDGELVMPDEFIGAAELAGLLAETDMTVLRAALRNMSQLPTDVHMSVNVSAVTLADEGYARAVVEAVRVAEVDPARLRLEVTETSLLDPTPELRSLMRALADSGASWFLDDFGTGYSSLSHMRDMPIAGLKLDRSFTAGLGADPTCFRLAQGLAGLAQGLGLETVAEGIETEEQAGILSELGWRQGQGWLFGKPAPLSSGSGAATG